MILGLGWNRHTQNCVLLDDFTVSTQGLKHAKQREHNCYLVCSTSVSTAGWTCFEDVSPSPRQT
jgi:hypothetical protein